MGDRGPFGMMSPERIDLGVIYPALSAAAQAWYMQAPPDQVLRTALNCYWAHQDKPTRDRRRVEVVSIYHSSGSLLRERIIARQNRERRNP